MSRSGRIAVTVAIILAAVAATASAQVEPGNSYLGTEVVGDPLLEVVPGGGAKETLVEVTLVSGLPPESRDATETEPLVVVETTVNATNATPVGWSAVASPSAFTLRYGQTKTVEVRLATGGSVSPNEVRIDLTATAILAHSEGEERVYSNATIGGRVQRISPVSVLLTGPPKTVGPQQHITDHVEVRNLGFYRNQFRIETDTSEDLMVQAPEIIAIPAQESEIVPVSIFGPRTYYEYAQSSIVRVTAIPVANPGASYTRSLVVNVSGFWLPLWTYPFFAMMVAGALYAGYRGVENVREDRRRYGHPGRPYTKQKKEQLQALEERDPEKAALFREKLEAKYERDLEAYKERKRKGKKREVGALMAKMDEREKKREKTRKSAIKTIKKGKKKGRPPQEIYKELDEDEREVLGDDLTPMLGAATPAAVALAAKDEEDKHALDEVREDLAEADRRRLRAEAAALAEHMREMGKDEDAILDEMSTAQRQAAGDDLDAILAGDDDLDPEAILDDLPFPVARKGDKFLDGLRKEREKLRQDALKTIKKGKKKDWSRKRILSELTDEQMHLVGGRLEMMLEAHFPEEVELLLLDPSEGLSDKEQKRREKLQDSLHDRRRKKMRSAAKKIEKLEDKGMERRDVLGELTRAEKWAVEDFIEVLVQPLPDAYRGLSDYLDKHDLPDKKAELWRDHLDHLRDKKVKHAKKALKAVDKAMRKGRDPRRIVDELSHLQRECLEEALPVLIKPELSKRIKGLAAHAATADIPDEEKAMWTEHVEELRERREDVRDDAVDKIREMKADGEPPEAIADALSARERDAVGEPLPRMLEATLPEDVAVLRALARDDRDPDAVQDAREAAQEARREALSEAIGHVRELRDGGGLLGPDPVESVREAAEQLDATEKALIGEALPALMRSDPVKRRDAIEAYLDEAGIGGVKREVWDGVLDDVEATIDEVREETVDELKDLKSDDVEPEEIADQLDEEQRSVLGDDVEAFLTAALPEDVEVLRLRTVGADADAIGDALSDAKDARSKARDDAIKQVKKAQDDGADLDAAVAGLPYSRRKILEDDPPETDEEGNVVEATGGLFSFGGGSKEDDDADEDDSGGGFSLPFGSSKPRSRKERAKELLAEGRSPAEVKAILQEEREAEEADEADEGGGGGFSLPFGGSSADDGAWKKDLAKRLIRAGVPKSEVAGLLREAEDRVGDLPGDERDDALDDFVAEVEDRRS